MAGFLIEVPHGEDEVACMHAIRVFMESGSHFLANADWGCHDAEHKAWMIVDVESKAQALQIVPPAFRGVARIIELFKVTREDMEEYKKKEEDSALERYHS